MGSQNILVVAEVCSRVGTVMFGVSDASENQERRSGTEDEMPRCSVAGIGKLSALGLRSMLVQNSTCSHTPLE